MAYNPGVSDISGQLRAQGMTRGMNSLLEGFDVGVKTYQQNKHIADTSIAKFGAAVANSDELKKLLTDENERSKLPSDVVKAYLKLNKEGSLGVREASLLGGFADSFLETAKAKQQQAYQAKMMANVDQQIAASQQAGTLAQAQNAREQMAANRAEGQYGRNLKAVEDMRRIMGTADTLETGVDPQFPAGPDNGPASLGSSMDVARTSMAPSAPPSGSPFMRSATPALQVPNSPLRSGMTTPQAPINILEDYQNKMGNVPVAGNMGGAGVLTVRAADRIRDRAEALRGTSLGQMIEAGITPTDEQMVNLTGRDLVATSAANRATAAAASKEAQNEFNARKIEIANARLQLAQDRADNKLDPFIKNLDDLLDLRRISPERHAELVDQWLTSKADARSEQAKLLAGVKDLFPATPATPATPPPKSRVVAPKGSVYMVDANGNVGLVLEKNVKKAMDMGGTVL
jgi:hypothetical protein